MKQTEILKRQKQLLKKIDLLVAARGKNNSLNTNSTSQSVHKEY